MLIVVVSAGAIGTQQTKNLAALHRQGEVERASKAPKDLHRSRISMAGGGVADTCPPQEHGWSWLYVSRARADGPAQTLSAPTKFAAMFGVKSGLQGALSRR